MRRKKTKVKEKAPEAASKEKHTVTKFARYNLVNEKGKVVCSESKASYLIYRTVSNIYYNTDWDDSDTWSKKEILEFIDSHIKEIEVTEISSEVA